MDKKCNPGRKRRRNKKAISAKKNAERRSIKEYIYSIFLNAVLEEVYLLSGMYEI